MQGASCHSHRRASLPPSHKPERQKRQVGDRRSATRFPSWWPCPARLCISIAPALHLELTTRASLLILRVTQFKKPTSDKYYEKNLNLDYGARIPAFFGSRSGGHAQSRRQSAWLRGERPGWQDLETV